MTKKKIALSSFLFLAPITILNSIILVSKLPKQADNQNYSKALIHFKNSTLESLNLKLESSIPSNIGFNFVNNEQSNNKLFNLESHTKFTEKEVKDYVLLKAKEFISKVKNCNKTFEDFVKIAKAEGLDISKIKLSMLKNDIQNEELKTFAFVSSIWKGTVQKTTEVINNSTKQLVIYDGIAAPAALILLEIFKLTTSISNSINFIES